MIIELLTEHHLDCLSLKGGCRGSSESPLVKMSNCLKSHATAQLISFFNLVKTESADVGMIVGIVVAVLVVIGIAVVVIVFVMKKRNKG